MASLAEHLSGPPVAIAPAAPVSMPANLTQIGLLCMSLSFFVFSCSVLAYSRGVSPRR